MAELPKTGVREKPTPGVRGVVGAIAMAVEALDVRAMRNRGKENPPGLQARMELRQDSFEFAERHVKERRVGENAIERCIRKIEGEKVLVKHLLAGDLTRHATERFRPIEPHRLVSEVAQRDQVSTGTTTQVENPCRRFRFDES